MEGQRGRSILCDLIYYNLARFSAVGATSIALIRVATGLKVKGLAAEQVLRKRFITQHPN
jgi:hypothetical protein